MQERNPIAYFNEKPNGIIVDPSRSTGWRDSLLIEKSELIFEL